MAKKSVKEMNILERASHSISAKIFNSIIQFAIVFGLIAVAFGFYLYSMSVQDQYSRNAHNIARSTKELIDAQGANHFVNDVLNIYEANLPSEEEINTEEYLDKYKSVKTGDYGVLRVYLNNIQVNNEASALYVAIYDRENNRLIYVLDSDYTDKYCPPGYIDIINESEIKSYLTNKHYDIDNDEKYGYLCTAWETISHNDKYIVNVYCDIDMEQIASLSRTFLWQYLALLAVVAIIIATLIAYKMKKNIAQPIIKINQAARDYIIDRDNENSNKLFFDNLNIHTGDEIESLAIVMSNMEKEINDSVENIKRVTSEKEKISAELNIASQIQEGMLPSIFPAFPERKEFDIYALMNPAKEVGGDFYDFFLIDDNHLALVIADVSGKGIPAALFMMASKILINNYAKIGLYDPAIILESVNKSINQNNPAEMFVTVWLGILNINTGILKAANAGHEYPCVCKHDDNYELLKDKHGMVIGAFDEAKYKTYEIQLEPNDKIFVYTDGVPEATNSNNELFGTDRLIEVLNNNLDKNVGEVLNEVKKAINNFVQDAPQFDDITMLGFKYMGTENKNEIIVDAISDNVNAVSDFINTKLEEEECNIKAQMQIDVAIDEIFSNIVNYAYEDKGKVKVSYTIDENPKAINITFIDDGKQYNPLENEEPDVTLSAEERQVGGLGIFLVRKTMDDVKYEYVNNQNVLTIKKLI